MSLLRPKAHSFERIMIYGDPKTGKTRLATALPDSFGDIIYFAADIGSESLAPIITEIRPRIHIVKSAPSKKGEKYDPDADAFNFALNDWTKEFPNARTIIWDTLTQTAWDVLQFIADEGQFSESKHIAIGSGDHQMNLPMEGDYRSAQERIDRLITYLFRQPMHIICVCHADYDQPKGGMVEAEGGPKTVGRATIRRLAGKFDTVLYTKIESTPPAKFGEPSTSNFYVYTAKHKIWAAGIRGGNRENPIPRVKLEPFPINFWNLFFQHFRTEKP